MSRAALTFPFEGLHSCVIEGEWRKCEDILPVLRQFAMKSAVAELDGQAEHADLVATFLLGVQERRRPLRARVVETAKALARSNAWEQVLKSTPLLLQAPKQAETVDVQAEPPQSAISVEAPPAEDLKASEESDHWGSLIPQADQLPVLLGLGASSTQHSGKKQADQLPEQASAQTLADAPNPFDDAVLPVSLSPPTVAEQLSWAVQAVLAIDTHTRFENWSVTAFAQLRKAVLHAGQLPSSEMMEVLNGEAAHAATVLTYLVDIVKGSPIRNHQVCEVVGLLLQCPSWQKAVNVCPALQELISHSDMPAELQARFESAVAQENSKGLPKWKRLSRWFLGCGQKDGQGVSSPRQGSRPAAAQSAAGA